MSRARFLDGVNMPAVEAGMIDPAQWKCELGTGGGLRLGLGLWLGGGQGGGGGPTPPTGMGFALNLEAPETFATVRAFNNAALCGGWTYNPAKLGPLPASMTNAAGELISRPNADYWRFPGPLTATGAAVLYWEGSQNGVTVGGTGVSAIGSPVAHGSGWKREFTYTFGGSLPKAGNYWISCTDATVGANVPTNVILCEKAIFDAYTVSTIPRYHADFIAMLQDASPSVLRFLDWTKANFRWDQDVVWADRAQTTVQVAGATLSAYQVFTAASGVDNDALVIGAVDWYLNASNITYFAARRTAGTLPADPFGSNGNSIRVQILAASGAGTITCNDASGGFVDIVITPPTGQDTAAGIKAFVEGSATADAVRAKRWITFTHTMAGSWGNNAGTSSIGVEPQTALMRGQFSKAPDGIPVEWIVELCDEVGGCIPWIPLPPRADANFYQQYAALLASLGYSTGILEWGNEPWNTAFKLFNWLQILSEAAGGTPGDLAAIRAQRANLLKAAYTGVVAGSATVQRFLNVQNSGATDYTLMSAISGVPAAHTCAGGAPYYGSGATLTPSPSTDPDVVAARMEASIPAVLTDAATNKTNIEAAGKLCMNYEGGQHDVPGGAYQTSYAALHSSDRMRRLTNMYIAEIIRRAEPVHFGYFTHSGALSAAFGAWGMIPNQFLPYGDAPKYKGWKEAMAGQWVPYFAPGERPSIPTTPNPVGTPITVTLPVQYQSLGASYQWKMDATSVGTNSNTYTPVSGDLGKVPTCEVTLTGTNESYTYVSNAGQAITPLILIDVWDRARILANGGNITLPANWTDNHTIHLLSRGGTGATGSSSTYRNGGGSSAAMGGNIPGLTPGGNYSASIPAQTTSAPTTFNAGALSCDYGRDATNASGGQGIGGLAANCVGANVYAYDGAAGGTVNATFRGAGAGAGSAGKDGAGKAGGAATGASSGGGGGGCNGGSSTAGGAGLGNPAGAGGIGPSGTPGGVGASTTGSIVAGNGNNGSGGGGGINTAGLEHGGDGSQYPMWTDSDTGLSYGPGSGGGGIGSVTNAVGGDGGGYGAGGGGGFTGFPGLGTIGLIVLEWQP